MTGPTGNSEFWFPSTSMFPSASLRGTLRVSGKQNSLFPLWPAVKCLIILNVSQYYGAHSLSFGNDASASEPPAVPRFLGIWGNTNLSSGFYSLTQPSPWSVQLILCCVVYFNKVAKVFTR